MTFILSQTDRRPMYVQIMDHICQKIEMDDWQEGAQLPSIRELAVALKISVITVKRAYLELERNGVIVVQHGKGSFVAPRGETAQPSGMETLLGNLNKAAESAVVSGISKDTFVDEAARAWQRKKEETEA